MSGEAEVVAKGLSGEAEVVAKGLSGVQAQDIRQGGTEPNSCCPAPTLLCGPNPIWTLAGNRWVLTPFGLAVRSHLERTTDAE